MSRYIDVEPYEDCRIVLHKEDPGVKVKDIPTANVEEVRHGKWIKKNNVNYSPFDGSPEYIYICSVCGREENKQEPYCNCGAKMDGGKNEKRVST